jgi:23S rRNA U2552 (ribose-2'-O)-methylase RlmE/FtsJ
VDLRGRNAFCTDQHFGMTLIDDNFDSGVPSWNKSERFLIENAGRVSIETGADGTGNLLSLENFDHCASVYGPSMDFITADGGFDFTVSFNDQEQMMHPLLFAQVAFAVAMQRQGGSFVLKLFDCFHAATVDILYLLASLYKEVFIVKPLTSRTGNSERYVVCKGYIGCSMRTDLLHYLRGIMAQIGNVSHVQRFLSVDIPLAFISKIEESNVLLGQQQIENIHQTLSMMDKHTKQDRIDQMVKNNINKCINWCVKYNIPYFPVSNTIFTGSSRDAVLAMSSDMKR